MGRKVKLITVPPRPQRAEPERPPAQEPARNYRAVPFLLVLMLCLTSAGIGFVAFPGTPFGFMLFFGGSMLIYECYTLWSH